MARIRAVDSISRNLMLAGVLFVGTLGWFRVRPDGRPAPASLHLALELEIGADSKSDDPRYELGEVLDARIMQDGNLWLLDGHFANGALSAPQIRVFDSRGVFVRRVGSAGNGPNEYRAPYALAQLRDGRVVVRDDAFPDRLHLYHLDGRPDTTWMLRPRTRWLVGAGSALQVDSSGTVWVAMRTGRPGHQSEVSFMRMRPNGTVIDQVDLPALPEVASPVASMTRVLPGGGTTNVGITVPFQAAAVWALGPSGRFAIARTDQYSVTLKVADDAKGVPPSRIARSSTIVPIDGAERASLRRGMEEEARRLGIATTVALPEVPKRKPPLINVSFADDGALLVFLSAPSTRAGERWEDHSALDVYGTDQRYRGQVSLPDGLRFIQFRANRLLGVWQDSTGAQVLRRYRLTDS
jgi:hypothetical protein